MKSPKYYFLFASILLLALTTCKKDPQPIMERFDLSREDLTIGTTSASIVSTYAYSGTIDEITVCVSKDGVHPATFAADINGKNFAVEMTGLRPATSYQYYYSVDYGFSKPFTTEAKTFTTLSESPTVRTIDVMSIDSTTVRVNCETVSDGGVEITERGICWNTYGNPNLDDESLTYVSAGLGQYSCRISGLALSTKYYVRAYAKNASGIGFGEVLEFETLAEALLPEVSTVEVSNVTSTTATCMGNVASDGGLELTERGVCWSLSANPTVTDSHATATDATMGVFEVAMTGLTPNKTYHVRAYATNAKGTAYGDDITFTTTEGLPVVTTSGITEITATSAKGGGEVTDQGASNVTERGICWGTSHNPTISGTHASNGTGAGSYTVSMTDLTPNATYYVRAYATNAQGTAYGAEVSFTALEGLPVVLTLDMTDITSTTAKGHAKVTDQGGSAVTERGVCWSTSPSPTTSGSHANSGTGTGEYAVSISDLTPGTRYYVRAYATNSQGTTYGEQKDFTTAAILPTVVTGDISGTTAHGEVTNAGGAIVTERGICWGTSHNPTTAGTHGSSGTGMGTFSVELTDLAPGTTYYVRAYATNSAGTAYGSEKTLTADATLPTVTTGAVSNITQTTAQGSGNVTNSGGANVTERGVCWSTSHNPTISGSHANNGTGTGGFTVSMTGLTANTHYYVRAYAKNSAGVSYGNEMDFTTTQNVSAPTVTTSQVTNIQYTSATGGGNVTATGGANVTERGICWSTSHNPTTSGSHLNSGTGTGLFGVIMSGLTANTTYYVRAYAINSAGTSYGSEVSFTTQTQSITVPTVTTSQVTNIQYTSATGGGNVTATGGANVTERGICWSTSHNPTTSGSHLNSGTGTGLFGVIMSGLTANTTYYVRAYAINSAGTAFGSEVSFTTSAIPSYTISVSANPSNGGTVNGGGSYNYGQTCTVTASANSGFEFTNWTENGSAVSNNASYTFTVSENRNLVANFEVVPTCPIGAINGLFSVSATQQVYFSQGNLQYIGSASTPYWKFAENQWDYLGNSGQGSDLENVDRDLFGWGTSGFNHGGVCWQPWSTSENYQNYFVGGYSNVPLGGQSDWGYNSIVNGGNTNAIWHTLSRQQWDYLLDERNTSSGIRYACAIVNGVKGLLILPDDWNSQLYSLLNFNNFMAPFSDNTITVDVWYNIFETNGAVFLPCAGQRSGVIVSYDSVDGCYWSTTPITNLYSGRCAYYVEFNDGFKFGGFASRYIGCSVRLVQDYQR